MKNTLLVTVVALVLSLTAPGARAQDLVPVKFGTNWLAQAEHGGFYQALADGTYARHGLDVTIVQGGPQVGNRAQLVAGKIQFYMGGTAQAISAMQEGIPTITLAAIFQKDPQILMSHPARFAEFRDLARASRIIMSATGFASYYAWMKARWPGFTDEKFQTYQFSSAAFLADPNSVQQGLLTSEPLSIQTAAGFTPDVWLLADQGFAPYSTTIEVMRPWLDANRDVARRFVEASIIGWYNYLYGDNAAANALIKAENPEMTDEQIAYGIEKLKEYGILISGDAETRGIGCMSEMRWRSFYDSMVAAGVFEGGLDISGAYTTEFVCKGLGMELAGR